MRINEILTDFTVFTTNEEKEILGKISNTPIYINSFNDREQIVIDNLVKKSLLTKINEKPFAMVKNNV